MNNKLSPYVMPGLKYRPDKINKYDSEAVIEKVCKFFHASEDSLCKRDGTHPTVYKRNILFYILYYDTKLSYQAIGKRFGNRDHTSIRNAIITANKELTKPDTEFDYAQDIKEIRSMIY